MDSLERNNNLIEPINFPDSKFTVIFRLPSGKYHIAYTGDPVNYIYDKFRHCKRGYYGRRECGVVDIIFLVRGDYRKKIKSFGISAFVIMVEKYSKIDHIMYDIKIDLFSH